jgi:hypothetical protein
MTDIRADYEKDKYIERLQAALIESELGSQEERKAGKGETRNWTQLAADCKRLEKELRDVKVSLGLVHIVNTELQQEKLARNDEFLVIDNRELHKQLTQARITIADMKANEKLGTYMVHEGETWKLQPDRAEPHEA